MISYKRISNASKAELIAQKKTQTISIILLAFAGIIYGFGTVTQKYDTDPSLLSVFIYFVSLVPLFSCCVSVFKDMHDIPTADVSMSMPISGTERYFSKLLTVARIWFIPFLISSAAAFVISFFANALRSSESSAYGDQTEFYPSALISFDLHMFLWFLTAVLFIISVTSVCQCCIGSKAESRYLPVLLMTALSIFTPAAYYFISDMFADISLTSYRSFSSPLFHIWTFSALSADFDSGRDTLLMILNCIISIAVMSCGAFICRRRDARSVGKPIVFKPFFEIIMAVMLTLFFMLVHTGSGNPAVLFIGWLGSIILRLIISRKDLSFAKIGIWTVIFALYYVIFLLFMYIAFLTGGFGALNRIPSPSTYSGMNAHVSITVNNDRNYWEENNYYDEHASFDISPTLGGRDELTSYIASVSAAAKRQNRIKGLFTYKMFDTHSDFYKFSINLTVKSNSGDYYDSVYRISFYVNESDREQLIRLTEEICGDFS